MPAARWRAAARSPLGLAAAGGLLVLVLVAILAPVVWGEAAAASDAARINEPPSADHVLGTDSLGRDMLARVLVASRLSISLALLATGIGVGVGLVLGTLPVVLGHRGGRLVVTVVNFAVAFPALFMALFFAVIFGVGARGAVLAIGLAIAPAFARLVQTLSASVAGRDFVSAARIVGVGRLRLIGRHILPNIAEPLVVQATIAAGSTLLAFAGLSFLGLGVQPPGYDWGRLLGDGLTRIYVNPAAAVAPGLAIVLAGLVFALAGETWAAVLGLRSQPSSHGNGTAALRPDPATVPRAAEAEAVLTCDRLSVTVPPEPTTVTIVDDVSLHVQAGESVGIVGESGSGKTMTALAVAGLAPDTASVTADQLVLAGVPILDVSERQLRRTLGTSVAMAFQDPMSSLNPSIRVGRQLAEVAETHQRAPKSRALRQAVERLRWVGVPDPAARARQYPHELSGGMRQRAMIGMGLMGEPRLIIADEPTSALDVTVQQRVLRLLRSVQRDTRAALLFISHDIAVVSQMCTRVLVMYAGRIVEELPTTALVDDIAHHPYTRALLASVPDLSTDREAPLPSIRGRPPEPSARPPGCAFAQRCEFADDQCRTQPPPLAETSPGRRVACWHPQLGEPSSTDLPTLLARGRPE